MGERREEGCYVKTSFGNDIGELQHRVALMATGDLQ